MISHLIFGLLAVSAVVTGSEWDSRKIAYSDIIESEPEWIPPSGQEIYTAMASSMLAHEEDQVVTDIFNNINTLLIADVDTMASTAPAGAIGFPGVGIFDLGGAFAYLKTKPQLVKTKFLFFRPEPNLSSGVAVPLGKYINQEMALNRSEELIDPKAKTYVIIHGFMSKCDPKIWTNDMVYSLLYSSGDNANVICVDWHDGCDSLTDYKQAAANTRVVGRQIANLLQGFQKRLKDFDLDKVHLIGHSLGAHVAGFAGSYLHGIGRITGLDPAGPLFTGQADEAHLDKSDAKFVDVIHTNGIGKSLDTMTAILWEGHFGTNEKWGHVDYFPNGGELQAGCQGLWKKPWKISDSVSCSHTRACLYFIESVKSACQFMSSPCNSYDLFTAKNEDCFACTAETCAPMGYHARKANAKGVLFVKTAAKEPFCGFHYMVSLKTAQDQKRTYGKIIMTMSAGNYTSEPFIVTAGDTWQNIDAGDTLMEIVVVPPIPSEPEFVEITYVGHRWWTTWQHVEPTFKVAMISITERFGKKLYVCREVLLVNGKKQRLPVVKDQCVLN